jgi:protein-L-isoaspartate(D-aspartate) O-methyltransferase
MPSATVTPAATDTAPTPSPSGTPPFPIPSSVDRDFADRDEMRGQRDQLVDGYVVQRVTDTRVIAAIRAVPRHSFVPTQWLGTAYSDQPLPIGHGQTISQPSLVAMMTELLRLDEGERVLEIGTGSGYQTALLAALAEQIFTIERVRGLAETAQAALKAAGVANVSLLVGDGTLGWSAYAPYEAILVAAGGPEVPPPLVEQLAPGGRMIIPLGARGAQTLTLVRRTEAGSLAPPSPLGGARFVPLVGEHGFDA